MTIILAAMLRYTLWDAIVWMRRLLPAGRQAAQKKLRQLAFMYK
ncbi:hypothetical protein [Citrobacter amalonaticus]|nr:hypothetical protein [Citrobacter amalonaticus]